MCSKSILWEQNKIFDALLHLLSSWNIFDAFPTNKYMLQDSDAAMGIRKKMRRQFYFYFRRRKGQIRRHYNAKNF